MSLFQCPKCGAKENTALGYFWGALENKCCSECHTGTWHGKFPKVLLPKGEFHTNGEGNLQHTKTGRTDVEAFALNKIEPQENKPCSLISKPVS